MTNFATYTLPQWLQSHHLDGMQRGIEKEGLRMQPDGFLAQTPHPSSLGSKLTHPYITTDYSESLLELITAPKTSTVDTLTMLRELHILVAQALDKNNELMWPLSMPCMLASQDENIPLADYGTSNIGKLKTLYRNGLGVRYGRRMQTIAGLHYNLSFADELFIAWQQHESSQAELATTESLADFKNHKYLALIRNFKRLSSLVLYLTGASPAVCPCFLTGRQHDLALLNKTTYYKPYATSLRMGKLGYTNSVQDQLDIRYNTLPEYIKGLRAAIDTPFAQFSQLGLENDAGEPIQINDHILQIENEYYSPIRPKQIAQTNEAPSDALERRGIAYVEFRAIDLDPYSDIGIRLSTACFLEVLALYCLLTDSPELLPDEDALLAENLERVVNSGREPNLSILTKQGEVNFEQWMLSHLENMLPLATLLDARNKNNHYRTALTLMLGRATHTESTLSAQILADTERLGSTWKLGHQLAEQHHQSLMAQTLSPNTQAKYEVLAEKSWMQQEELEQADAPDFQTFLQAYR
ncbi:glutamate--cysteine ligase [Psychrobacter sp. I-STPA6b]|uniref:glutamate--cysteine ligase n=1 Tax=Psychrobacter sp. I-STPA6b TaxID=2585718 RepID=UPI001D0CAF93|nr:glutamate--cysteine ligase [Psychrobacter sp. I-STPA6b]